MNFDQQFKKGIYESIWVRFKFGNKNIIVGNVYRPPGNSKNKITEALDIHYSIINTIKNDPAMKFCSLYLTGDMNIDLLKNDEDPEIAAYLDSMLSFAFYPCITKPTRFETPANGVTRTPSLIDHIFSDSHTAKFSGILLSDISDHFPVFFIDQLQTPKTKNATVIKREINDKNTKTLCDYLKNIDWLPIINNNDHVTASDNFFSIINEATTLAFPLKEVSTCKIPKNKKLNLPWFSSGIAKSSKKKGYLFSKMKKKPTDLNITNYKNFKRIFNSVCRAAKKKYYLEKFSLYEKDCRETWKLINTTIGRTTKTPQSFPDIFTVKNKIYDTPLKIVNGFNDFFTDVAVDISKKIPKTGHSFESFLGPPCQNKFAFSRISAEDLIKKLKKMKPKTSFGQDLVSNKLLKTIAPIILTPLVHIINLSLCNGYVHCTLKAGVLKPLFKSGTRSDFTNYRPIALLSAMAKLLEKCAIDQLAAHFERNSLFYKHQYGFRSKHSTTHAIFNFADIIHSALENDLFNISVFIDLRKAFDTVDFLILLKKLDHYGISGLANEWFRSYLSERTQVTEINGVRSHPRTITIGVPQGSVAGPFLFLILINDLYRASDAQTILFADDTTVQLSGPDQGPLFAKMNVNLAKLETWFAANLLTLNSSKTKFVLFANKGTHTHDMTLSVSEQQIEQIGTNRQTKTFKFLGLNVDDTLTWTEHIKKTRKKANSGCFGLSAVKNFIPQKARLNIYHSLIMSHLTYASLAVGCASNKDWSLLESAQKKAIRHVSLAKYNAHTEPIFKSLQLLTLKDTLNLSRALFVHGFVNCTLPPAFSTTYQFLRDEGEERNRNDIGKIFIPAFKYPRLLSPKWEAAKFWNSLSYSVRTVRKVSEFRAELYQSMLDNYVETCDLDKCRSCGRF